MCLVDWRLGRLVREVFHDERDNANDEDIPANNNRVAIMVATWSPSNPTNFLVRVNADGRPLDLLIPTAPRAMYSLTTHGDVARKRFTFSSGDEDNILRIVEFLMPEKYLATALEEFYQQYGVK